MATTPTPPRAVPEGVTSALRVSERGRFRLQARAVFLTYAQCPLDRVVVADNLRVKSAVEWMVVARERHEDGEWHLHAAVRYKMAIRTRDERYFDVDGYHPKIEKLKSVTGAVRYLTKEDTTPLVEGIDVQALLAKKTKGVCDAVARKLLDGATIDELMEDHCGFVLMHKRQIEDFQSYASARREASLLLPWGDPHLETPGPTSAVQATQLALLETWLRDNIKRPRLPRSPQLYLYGPPGIGKSRMLHELRKYLRVYDVPRSETFYDQYENNRYDLAVLDEFRADKPIQWLNGWLDGYPLPLAKKGKQCVKLDNLPTVIISNYPLRDCYAKANQASDVGLDALESRLTVVQITVPFTISCTPPPSEVLPSSPPPPPPPAVPSSPPAVRPAPLPSLSASPTIPLRSTPIAMSTQTAGSRTSAVTTRTSPSRSRRMELETTSSRTTSTAQPTRAVATTLSELIDLVDDYEPPVPLAVLRARDVEVDEDEDERVALFLDRLSAARDVEHRRVRAFIDAEAVEGDSDTE